MANVLVVDDSSTMREIVSSYLQQHGFEVTLATDGRDGLLQLEADPGIKLVISDVNMPNMDGLAMAEKIRTEQGNKQVHIIMLTTEASDAMKQQGQASGAKAWMVKPFQPAQMLTAVSKLILP